MQKPVPHMVFPNLPRDRRPYDLNHYQALRQWAEAVTHQSQFQGTGETLPAGAMLTVSHAIHHVSGSGTITSLEGPPDTQGDVTLIADGPFSIGTGGNVTGGPLVATVGRAYRLTFDGQVWALHAAP